ncbi:uncharacterized protein [Haliotis cracherodii]|uniref:uncharacterized protein n=1 Tax=Haliotis cracherodii TaxID=6455 RepID=UPI0039EB9005
MRPDHSSASDGEDGIPVSQKHGRHVLVSHEAPTTAGTSHEANNNQSHEAVGDNGRPKDIDLENRSRKRNRKDWKGFTIPKRDQAISRHRHRKRNDSSTSSSHSDSSSSSSSSDTSSSESSVSEDCDHNDCTVSTDNHRYKRFKSTDDRAEQELSNELLDYAHEHFNHYIKDEVITKNILEGCPTPKGFVPLELDEEWSDMLEEKRFTAAKSVEAGLGKIQSRLLNVMGPLGQVWQTVDKIRDKGGEEIDVNAFLNLVEKTVCLLGQANVATTFYRRLNILTKLMKSQKKAQKFLSKNEKKFSDKKALFGKGFYKKLLKLSKDRKKRLDMERQFSDYKNKSHYGFKSSTRGFSRGNNRPFHRGPSSSYQGYRGGGRYSTNSFQKVRFTNSTRKRDGGGRGREFSRGRIGIRAQIYLDNLILANPQKDALMIDRDSTLEILEKLGFVVNWKKSVLEPWPDVVITTDASKLGWGAVYGKVRTGGVWSLSERKHHINVLELMAAWLSIQTFAKSRTDVHIHLRMDNRSAVAYLNKKGGTKSRDLLTVAQMIWDFCLERKNIISAEYLPGKDNVEADWESRHHSDSSNWKLKTVYFKQINKIWGPINVDLFADRLNRQVDRYVSWRPDPTAWQTDAFLMEWKDMKPYAFPPFRLIGRCLMKVKKEKSELILIAPTWQSQPWFPILMSLLTEEPILLPPDPQMLSSPAGETHPLMEQGSLTLAAWRISGVVTSQKAFLNRLPSYSPNPGAQAPGTLTTAPGRNGVVGVGN